MKKRDRALIIFLLILACLALVVSGTFAAYTNVRSIKRVAVVKGITDDLPFSSNYLSRCDRSATSFPDRYLSATEGTTAISISLTVCNFPQDDVTKFSKSNIAYTLTISIQDADGNSITNSAVTSNISVNDSALTSSYSGSLTGGSQDTDVYHISFTNISALSPYTILVKATPSTDSGINDILAANLVIVHSSVQTDTWTGKFLDRSVSSVSDPKALDAFNYEISGSAKQSVTLSWNTDFVNLSPLSRNTLGNPAGSNSITFDVGGENSPNSYRLQFYRTNNIPEGETWDQVENYVSFQPN